MLESKRNLITTNNALKGVKIRVRTEQMNKRDFKTQFKITREKLNPDEKVIEGYFALYESETELFPNTFEIISKGAFDNTLKNDIRALWNHSTQYVLGRNTSGSLELRVDEKGLFGIIKLPNTQYANDLFELVQRGDVDQCSFGFNILNEDLEELASGGYRWRINEIDLHEISVVTFPAYENTSVQARHKQVEQIEQRKLQEKKDKLTKKIKGLTKC
jgi:HK97 family phage prohead protease